MWKSYNLLYSALACLKTRWTPFQIRGCDIFPPAPSEGHRNPPLRQTHWMPSLSMKSRKSEALTCIGIQIVMSVALPTTFTYFYSSEDNDTCCTPCLLKQAGPQLPQTNAAQSHCGLHNLRVGLLDLSAQQNAVRTES